MKMFQMRADGNRYENLTYANPDDSKRTLDWCDGTSMAGRWFPMPLEILKEPEGYEKLPRGDFPCFISGAAVFTQKAVTALADLLEGQVELLPIICEAGDYQLANVIRVVDALDEANSDVQRFEDGRVMDVERYAFHPEKLKGLTIFKLPQFRRGRVYVTERFVDRVREAGLKGFRFELLWDSEVPRPPSA